MNKNHFRRWLQSKEFTDKLYHILHVESPERQPQALQRFLLANVPPSTFVPKKKDGWEPQLLKSIQLLEI